MTTTLRILLADDHPIYRQGLRDLLANAPDFTIVGEATTGDEAVALARELTPDVAIVDAQMPGTGGLVAAQRIRDEVPGCAVVIMTAENDESALVEAARVGPAAVLPKDVQPDHLADAVRRVARGECLTPNAVLAKPMIASRVLREFRAATGPRRESEESSAPLSAREIEVLAFIARGSSNKEIARALNISDQTVKNHITSILRKLAVGDRTQAVVFALRQGWIKV